MPNARLIRISGLQESPNLSLADFIKDPRERRSETTEIGSGNVCEDAPLEISFWTTHLYHRAGQKTEISY